MSTIVEKRRAIQRTINWRAYQEQREHLSELFPAIMQSGQHKAPLALGIKHDLIGANTGLSAADVGHFLRAYTFGPKYLRALKAGATRVDLDWTPAGVVTSEEAAYARLSLDAHYADRERRGTVRSLGARAVESALFPVKQEVGAGFAYRFAREAA